MRTSSCKAKGRRLCKRVKELLHKYAPDLKSDDIWVTPSGCTGADLKLSPAAQYKYPFSIECKNQQSLQIWSALKQAASHVVGNEIPVLFFSRNNEDTYVALRAEDFVRLVS